MIHQLLASIAGEVIARLLWAVGTMLAQGWSERRTAHASDLGPDREGRFEQVRQQYGTHLAGPRYPGTF